MKLLIVTQTVDSSDPVLGFFYEWIIEFAKQVETLTVICLYEGVHSLPQNVTVYSLGKEHGARTTFSYAMRFKLLAWKVRHSYDTVFVHMNPEYLLVAGGMWRLLGKKTVLWYMHKAISWRLRVGIFFANYVCTASTRSMRVVTSKKRVVGHGIRVQEMEQQASPAYPPLELLSVGRLSRIKRTDLLIRVLAALTEEGLEARLTIVGGAATEDGKVYEKELHALAENLGVSSQISFSGPLPHSRLSEVFSAAHLFLHASDTGSLDKASLEPLLAGVPVITVDTELALASLPGIIAVAPTVEGFVDAIKKAQAQLLWEDQQVRAYMRNYVIEHHDLSKLIPRILAIVGS